MMAVRVLYFAGLREAIGFSEEEIDLPATIRTVGQLASHLAGRHRAYAERSASIRFARNEEFADHDDALKDGDVIALIPPMAGG